MTTPDIPTEALEPDDQDPGFLAALHAVHNVDCPEGPGCREELGTWGRYGRYARAAIDAAAPHLIAEGRRQRDVELIEDTGPRAWVMPDVAEDVIKVRDRHDRVWRRDAHLWRCEDPRFHSSWSEHELMWRNGPLTEMPDVS